MTNALRHRLFRFLLALLLATGLGAQAAKPAPVDLPEARVAVMDLPEVKAWQDARKATAEIQKEKGEKGAPPTAGILTGRREVGKAVFWAVTLYENPQVAPKKWAVFMVRASDGRVFVEGADGKPVPLEQWRKTAPKPEG